MQSQREYYFHKLYPFQDAMLSLIGACDTDFYLTGGTALSRWYLHHRFSEDLDFFVNDASNFPDQVDRAIAAIKKSSILMSIDKKAEGFVRIHCSAPETDLKIDFVNDVPYHSGTIKAVDLFPRVDGWWNILSNKITALDRREPKDVADILFLCRAYSFEWEKVFQEAEKKTVYIDPVDISVILNEFPKEYFSRIHWDVDISLEDAFTDIHIIAKDILQKKGNSLAGK